MFIFNNLYYNSFYYIKKGFDESFCFSEFTREFGFGKC